MIRPVYATILRWLISSGMTINKGLVNAAEKGYFLIVDKLISIGATEVGEAMLKACSNGHIETARVLLNKGAVVRNSHLAAAEGHADVLDLLKPHLVEGEIEYINGWYIRHTNSPINTYLIDRAEKGIFKAVRMLLNLGACDIGVGDGGDEAMLRACSNGHVETVRVLLGNRVNVTDRHLAAAQAHQEVLNLLRAHLTAEAEAESDAECLNGWMSVEDAQRWLQSG